MGIACALGVAVGAAPDARAAREPRVMRVLAAALLPPIARDALPDVLARGDLGAAGRPRALRAARRSRAGWSRPAGRGDPGGDRGEGRLRRRAAGARGLRHVGRGAARPVTSALTCWSRAGAAARRCGPPRCRWTRGCERVRVPRAGAAGCRRRRGRRARGRRARGRRAAADRRRPRDVQPGPLHGRLARPARRG